MRRFALVLAAVSGLVLAAPARPAAAQPIETAEVSIGTFQDALSPYGEWIEVAGYGPVWRPSAAYAGPDFRPYGTGGHWVYTDYGWSWESDYAWGWAPFHYGRWMLQPTLGWVWVPGYEWGPAWVDWRYGGSYVGWAPLPPPGVSVSVGIGFGSAWCFVNTAYFVQPNVYAYALPPRRVREVYVVTQPVEVRVHERYFHGPPVQPIAEASHVVIQPTPVRALPSVRETQRVVPSMPRGEYARPTPSSQGGGNVRPTPSYPAGGGHEWGHPTYAQPQPTRPAPSYPAPSYPAPQPHVMHSAPMSPSQPVMRPQPVFRQAPPQQMRMASPAQVQAVHPSAPFHMQAPQRSRGGGHHR